MRNDDYNPTSHTLTILMVLAVCVAVILMLLASCRTIHDTERVYTHDTLYVHHSDTVREVKLLAVHDTTRQVEQHYITINQAGDTIREVHHYHDVQHTIVVDSTERYEAKVDSLQRLLDREREKEKVVEKKPWKFTANYMAIRVKTSGTMTPYTLKSSALAALRRRYAEQRGQVLGIEPRLADYFDGLVTVEPNADADPQDPQPAHNIYELLGPPGCKPSRPLSEWLSEMEQRPTTSGTQANDTRSK